MTKHIITGLLFLIIGWQAALSQNSEILIDSIPDENYREDQFYIGITYNILNSRPSGISQNNLSNGLHLGFIRDFPLNERRNKAIGIGIGYSYNSYFHNLKAFKAADDDIVVYEPIGEDVSFDRNKFRTHLLEVPLQFRWRTSTGTEYKFWRIYGGFKFGYVLSGVSKFLSNEEKLRFVNNDFNRFQYGITLSAGYNTWNFYAYYGLNRLFKDGTRTISGEDFEMRAIKVGLMFYIL